MERGRPSKYNDETIPKTQDYLENFQKYGDEIPSIAGLADFLGVTRTCIYTWMEDEEKSNFSYIIERILGRQEKVLSNKGLNGDFTPTISKLILGKHGYSDKVEQEHTGAGGGPMQVAWNVHPVRPVDQKPKEENADSD